MRAPLLLTLVAGLSLGQSAQPPLTVKAAARAFQPGDVVLLTVSTREAATAVTARAFDHDLAPFKVDDHTWRVLVGIDLESAPKTYPVTIVAGRGTAAPSTTYSVTVKPKTFETRTLTVDDAFVNPPASVSKRIADEAALLTKIWAQTSPERVWGDGFVRPVPDPANSAFGKRSVFNGQARSPHTGADFESPAGRPVNAPADGRIVLARELYYSGNTVILDHGLGLFSLFAHFSQIDAREGEMATRGQVLGKVGATGRVTGPHLHWAIRLNGARVDPLSLLEVAGLTLTQRQPRHSR